jgi:hypothetical protein
LAKTDPSAHLINCLQTLSLLLYYPLENISYLSGKGVFPLSPAREASWSTWGCRFWAAYVVLDVWRLARQREGMRIKERVLRMQGGEKEDVEALKREKESWLEEVVVNVYVILLLDSYLRLTDCAAVTHRSRSTGHSPMAHGQTK